MRDKLMELPYGMVQDCEANDDLEIRIGSDDVTRINVDGICVMRIRHKAKPVRIAWPNGTSSDAATQARACYESSSQQLTKG